MAEQDYFEAHLAVAPGSVETMPGAVAQVYAVEDTSFTTPLGITNLDGTPMPNLRANQHGVYPPFRVMTGEWQVVARSGGVSTPMMSVQGPARAVAAQLADEVSAAETARDAAQLAQAEAEAAAEQATAPTDAQVATLIQTPSSATATQLSATIGDDRAVAPLTDESYGPRFVKTGVDLLALSDLGLPYQTVNPILAVVNAEHIPGALGSWYMYLSTDHDPRPAPSGGLVMAYADSPEGPWSVYEVGGEPYVFQPATGIQSEGPQVVWNDDTGLFHIFWQMSGATYVMTSPSGLLDDPANSAPTQALQWTGRRAGDGYVAYLAPFRLGGQWVGYNLYGGKDYGAFTICYSNDGLTWTVDPRRLGYSSDLSADSGYRIEWHSARPFVWRGQVWTILRHGPHASGGSIIPGEDVPNDWVITRLATDMRAPVGRPRVVCPPLEDEEYHNNPRAIVSHHGKLYAFYRANGGAGATIRVAIAEG